MQTLISVFRWFPHIFASTPRRSFFLYPVLVIAFEIARRGGPEIPMPYLSPLLLWGYLEYRLTGRYRRSQRAGSLAFGEVPQRLLQGGPFRFSRNPMYLGHLIFTLGIALVFMSWLGAAIFLTTAIWFHRRVLEDEVLLRARFGTEYEDYCSRVKRWVPFLL